MAKTLETIIQMGGKLDPSLEKAVQRASGDLEKLSAAALKANQKAEMAVAQSTMKGAQKTAKAQLKAEQASQKALLQETLRNNKTMTAAQKRQAMIDFELDQKQAIIDLDKKHADATAEFKAEQETQLAYYSTLAEAAEKAAGKSTWEESTKAIQAMGQKLESVGATVKKFGRGITTYIATPLLALGGKSYGLSKEYESELMQVMKVAEGTDEQYEQFKQSMLEHSQEMPITYQELLRGAASGAKMGIPIDDLEGFTVVMAKLDTATDLSAESASESVAKITGVLDVGADNLTNMGSAIVALGNNFATNESNIVDYTYRMMSTGDAVNMAAADVMGFGAALHASGIEAEAGGSAWSKLMKSMEVSAQVSEKMDGVLQKTGKSLREMELMASNSPKDFKGIAESFGLTTKELNGYLKAAVSLEDYAGIAGVTTDQFKKMWASDPTEMMLRFVEGLGGIKDESAVGILNDMGLTEVRLSNAILAAAGAQELFRSAIETSRKAWDENTALDKEYNMFASTTEAQDKMLANKGANAMANYGDTVAEALEPIKTKISEVIEAFGNLDKNAQSVLVSSTAYATAGGGIIWALGAVIEKAGVITSFFGKHPGGAVLALGLTSAALGTWWVVTKIQEANTALTELQTAASAITLGVDAESKNAVLADIQEVADALGDLTGPEAKRARMYGQSVKAGYGDQEMYVKALAYEQAVLKQRHEAITGVYSDQIIAAQERMAEAAARGDTASADQENALIAGLRAELPVALAEANAQYTQSVSALADGMLSQYGDMSAMLAQYGEYYQAIAQIDQFKPDWMDEYAQAEYLKTAFPESVQKDYLAGSQYASFEQMADSMAFGELLAAYESMSDTVVQEMAKFATPEAMTEIGALLSAIVEGDNGQFLDPKSLSGALLDAFALIDYANANKGMSEAGYGDAMSIKLPQFMDPTVLGQMQGAANAQNGAATSLKGAGDESIAAATRSQTAAASLDSAGGRLISAAYSLSNVQPKFSINFSVPGMATGGTVTGPTLSWIGEGRDDETVVPHNDSLRSKSLLAEAAAGVGLGLSGGGQVVFAPQITIQGNADEESVSSALDDAFEQFKAWYAEIETERGRTSLA